MIERLTRNKSLAKSNREISKTQDSANAHDSFKVEFIGLLKSPSDEVIEKILLYSKSYKS